MTGSAAAPTVPRRRAEDRLTVGYLHLGRAEGGVPRYGRNIAAGTARRKDIDVITSQPGERDASFSDLRRAGRRLAPADVVHIQWKPADWGGRFDSLPRLEVFMAACRRPLVVTLHDVYERLGWRDRWIDPGAIALRRLTVAGAWLVVHSDEEKRRLAGMVDERRLSVVPHFVEERPPLPDRDQAKRELGLEGRRVITLLGYMTRRKGHRLVIEALPSLPSDVVAVFAGSTIEGREARGEELEAYARELGVAERLRFTGYVSDDALERVLAATDLAVAPFRDMSASGAVSTWISTGRPIVTSDLPAFRAYEAMAKGSMRIFSPLTPEAFAARVSSELESGLPASDRAIERLRTRLATPRIVERYIDVYRAAAAR